MATTKKTSTAASPSLAKVLKGTRGDVSATIKDWTGFVRAVPSSVGEPAKLVEKYFGVREQALARRRARALELVEATPKVRVPLRRNAKETVAAQAV
jgi:hypothetical protein